MKSRKQILHKMKIFYNEVRSKRKGKRMRLQVDNDFQQVKIKDLNNENNAEMLTSSLREGKAFQNSMFNMNLMKSMKYGLSPKETEKQSLAGEQFKTVFNMHGIEKT